MQEQNQKSSTIGIMLMHSLVICGLFQLLIDAGFVFSNLFEKALIGYLLLFADLVIIASFALVKQRSRYTPYLVALPISARYMPYIALSIANIIEYYKNRNVPCYSFIDLRGFAFQINVFVLVISLIPWLYFLILIIVYGITSRPERRLKQE